MEFFLSRCTFAVCSFTFLPKPQSISAVASKTKAFSGGTAAAQQYESVGRDHCHFACSALAYYIMAHFILSKLSTGTQINEDLSAPLPMTVVGTCTLGSSQFQGTCHTQSLYLECHPINSIAMEWLQTSYHSISSEISWNFILKYLA